MILRGARVIVTGGVRGLGRAVVEALLAQQALVTVFDVDTAGLAKLQAERPGVASVQCDVSSYAEVLRATTRYHSDLGAPDALINNAGIIYSAPLAKITASGLERHDIADWQRVLDADLSSVFYMTSCVAGQMLLTRKRGVVVSISSVAAEGNAGQSAYSAAKAGVNALTVAWARELGPMGIRFAAVAPGFIDTESTRSALSERRLRDIVSRVSLRRLGKAEEVAQCVISVLQNDFINGAVIKLDGGVTL